MILLSIEQYVIYIEDFIGWFWHFVEYNFPYSLIVVALLLVIIFYIWRVISLSGLYLRAINPFKGRFAKIVKVVDGDTIVVGSINNRKRRTKVRLIGIDTPESIRSLYQDVMPFGEEATRYVKNRLSQGKRVILIYDQASEDKFGRTLAYVYLMNGEFFNETLIKKGYAFAERYPPNVKYCDVFAQLEQEAKNQKLGLWKIYEDKKTLKSAYKKSEAYQKFKQKQASRKTSNEDE